MAYVNSEIFKKWILLTPKKNVKKQVWVVFNNPTFPLPFPLLKLSVFNMWPQFTHGWQSLDTRLRVSLWDPAPSRAASHSSERCCTGWETAFLRIDMHFNSYSRHHVSYCTRGWIFSRRKCFHNSDPKEKVTQTCKWFIFVFLSNALINRSFLH